MKKMEDLNGHIELGISKEDNLWHAYLYRNHPSPSGFYRPYLSLSTTLGKPTAKEALEYMKSGLKPEYYKTLDVPKLNWWSTIHQWIKKRLLGY
jgi:hypothetical protein